MKNDNSYIANKENLVSVIMPSYNSENYIRSAISSVIDQTYTNWELIIVDDASTDMTRQVVQSFHEADSRIKYYRLTVNSGAAIARNKAIDYAIGRYIAFLDSDDVWFPHKLSAQIRFMKDNNYTFSCTSYTKIDENGNFLNRTIKAKKKLDYDGLLKKCPGNSTVVYDANELGKFKIPNIKKRNDYVMWLQVIKKAGMLYGIEEPLASHRVRTNGISSKKASLVFYHWKVYRDIEHLSFYKSCFLIFYWIVATIFKLR